MAFIYPNKRMRGTPLPTTSLDDVEKLFDVDPVVITDEFGLMGVHGFQG